MRAWLAADSGTWARRFVAMVWRIWVYVAAYQLGGPWAVVLAVGAVCIVTEDRPEP